MFSCASKKYKDVFKAAIPALLVSAKCMASNTKIGIDTMLNIAPCPSVDAQTTMETQLLSLAFLCHSTYTEQKFLLCNTSF